MWYFYIHKHYLWGEASDVNTIMQLMIVRVINLGFWNMLQWCDANWLALAAEKSLKKCLIFHVIMLASIDYNGYSATMCTSSHWTWPQTLFRLHSITIGLHCIAATATRLSQRRCLGDVYLTSAALALRWQMRVGSICLHAGKITSHWSVCVWGGLMMLTENAAQWH